MGIDHQTSELMVCNQSAGLTDSRREEKLTEKDRGQWWFRMTTQIASVSDIPVRHVFPQWKETFPAKLASILRVHQEEHKRDCHPQIRRETTEILVTVFIISWGMSERTQLFLRCMLSLENWSMRSKNGSNYSWLLAHKGMWNCTTLSDTSLIRFCCRTSTQVLRCFFSRVRTCPSSFNILHPVPLIILQGHTKTTSTCLGARAWLPLPFLLQFLHEFS